MSTRTALSMDSSKFIKDNPYYFSSVTDSAAKSPEIPSRGFSFFRRRSSSSSKSLTGSPAKHNYVNTVTSLEQNQMSLPNRRGSLRSLLRSKSTNSSVTYSQGIIIGECRPSTDSIKLTNFQNDKFQRRQRLGSYTESTVSYNGSDDVFLPSHSDFRATSDQTSDSTLVCGTRRHSIGTFSSKDRMRCGSYSDEVPKMPAPKPPQICLPPAMASSSSSCSSVLRKGSRCNKTMDDILIVTSRQSEPAILWANYLKTRFDKITKQRGRIPFNFLHLKLDDATVPSSIIHRCLATKLQIVVVCSGLLSLPEAHLMNQLSSVLKPDKVLGLLLEVSEEQVLAVHKKSLPSYRQWKRCVVQTQDQNFVGNVLGIATDILGPALRDQPLLNTVPQTVTRQISSNEGFTVFPKKVKVGQNKVVIILNEPLNRDDNVHVKIEKTGESMDIMSVKRRNPYTLQFAVPEDCMEVSMMIDIYVEKNNKSLGCRPIKCESRLRELEQLLKNQDSPLEFLCSSIGIPVSDHDKLDIALLQAFQKNVPPNFHLLTAANPLAKHQNEVLCPRESSPEEYPTLLHFSARWGLQRLTMQLLECPGGEMGSSMRNINGKTPLDLAEMHGQQKCMEILKNFSQMHEFTTMYHYFKGVSETAPNKVVVDLKSEVHPKQPSSPQLGAKDIIKKIPEYMEMNCTSSSGSEQEDRINAVSNLNYITVKGQEGNSSIDVCDGMERFRVSEEQTTNELKITEPAYYESKDSNKTDKFSMECSKALEESQADLMSDYLIQPSNRPVTITKFSDYMTHPSNKPVYSSDNCYMNDEITKDDSHMKLTFAKKVKKTNKEESHTNQLNTSTSGCSTLRRQESDSSKLSVDDELLEIINDFKNNVFSINEVEQLVSHWRNRNDVQQSFKDKQDQLQRMREEYERLQHQIKEKMKRPTPFERMKKLFSRSKSVERTLNDDGISMNPNSQRPPSTLSLQSVSSSSSCGRLSTGSVCSGTSMGDSGTHSDHEDRRQNFPGNCRVGTPGSLLLDNYMIPPAPRPILTPVSTPTPVEEKFSGQNEHYILFPSNAPVFSQNHDYINFNNSLNTIDEAKETSDITVQPIKIQKSKQDEIYGPISRHPNLCSFKSANQVGAEEAFQFGTVKPGEDIELKNLLLQGSFTKNISENKVISRQSSEDNNSIQNDHNYINFSV